MAPNSQSHKVENYKLKSEIREFIIQKASEHPELGCRKLSGLIEQAFKVDISKSTISTVLKSEGLNKPVGRCSSKKKDRPATLLTYEADRGKARNEETLLLSTDKQPELLISAPETALPNMGCWFLKAAELCLGGAQAISDILSSIKEDDRKPADFLPLIESLLYLALFGAQEYKDLVPLSQNSLSALTGKKYSAEDLQWCLDYLKLTQPITLKIFNRLVALRAGVLAIKFILEDNSFFFLDAGGHSIWSTNRIPKYFSAGIEKTKEWLNEAMAGIKPLTLQAPPGFAAPTSAFLDFLASFQCEKPDKTIKRIELYSPDNLLIDTIQPPPQKKRYFILGLWPWQYKNRDRGTAQQLSLRSLAMTNNDNRKILDIITNLEKEKHNDNEVIAYYLERWPNPEIGYQDFLDKIGHFHQCAQIEWRQKNNVQFQEDGGLTLNVLLDYWRRELNLYCQRYFFPLSCHEWDFLLLKERFYNLQAKVYSETALLKVVFELPKDFPHLQDLSYACQRVNEADIHLLDRRKLAFEAGARIGKGAGISLDGINP